MTLSRVPAECASSARFRSKTLLGLPNSARISLPSEVPGEVALDGVILRTGGQLPEIGQADLGVRVDPHVETGIDDSRVASQRNAAGRERGCGAQECERRNRISHRRTHAPRSPRPAGSTSCRSPTQSSWRTARPATSNRHRHPCVHRQAPRPRRLLRSCQSSDAPRQARRTARPPGCRALSRRRPSPNT